MRPIQLSRFDFDSFLGGREQFTRDEWIDVIIRSIGLEPSKINQRLKFHFFARLFTFVEANYNFIELGPRSTGKSYNFSEFSPYTTLVSGGQATTPILFYNNARRKVGLVGFWDTVAFDEVAGIRIKDQDSIQIMKDYMANGRFSRGVEVITNAGLAFVGNIDYSIDQLVNSSMFDLFVPLPDTFDLAVMDRFHTYLPGWEMLKNSSDFLTPSYGFITDYLAEAFHHLFLHTNRYDWVNKHCKLGDAIEGRDEVSIKKTICAFLKLLHPTGEPTSKELDQYIEYAVEGRRRIKEQMNKRKTDDEFARINLSFIDSQGKERIVFCPESRGSAATQNPNRRVIEDFLLKKGDQRGKVKLKPAQKKDKASEPEQLAISSETTGQLEQELGEKHIKIFYGDIRHSYESILGDYLRGAKKITIEDPYIRSHHQISNFVRFCELLVKIGSAEEVNLITGYDSEEQRTEAEEKFESIRFSMKENSIKLNIIFKEHIHDRDIQLDNGWRIKIGRGFDIYQPPDNWFVVGANDFNLRPCLETQVDIFKWEEKNT